MAFSNDRKRENERIMREKHDIFNRISSSKKSKPASSLEQNKVKSKNIIESDYIRVIKHSPGRSWFLQGRTHANRRYFIFYFEIIASSYAVAEDILRRKDLSNVCAMDAADIGKKERINEDDFCE